MANWTEHELRATVRAYLRMLAAECTGASYSKASVRRELRRGALKARSEASIEYRMRNISSVLADHGRPVIKGYLPAANVGEQNAKALWVLVQAEEGAPAWPAVAALEPAGADRRLLQTAVPPIIYFNIGWMESYAGNSTRDPTRGAHGYLQQHAHGAEAFNFRPTKAGFVQGYRPPGTRQQTNIDALGAPAAANTVGGVLVVWLAKEPASGQTLVVGWYKNAIVHRAAVELATKVNGERISYSAKAAAADATLVPAQFRTFQVMSSRVRPGAGFGQNPTWYGAAPVNRDVWAYIKAYDASRVGQASSNAKLPPRNADPELRRKVEKAAVAHATGYYANLYGPACEIRSVEIQAKGWDLEVHTVGLPLLVEVKGLLGSTLCCELTPNEFEKMMLVGNRERYVIYVLNNALAEPPATPVASVFEYAKDNRWRTADGRVLEITQKIAAVLTCS